MTKDNILELEGQIIEGSNSKFKVKVSEHLTVLCTLSGKIRMNGIKVIIGDRVKIEVSAYNLYLGRIIYRLGR